MAEELKEKSISEVEILAMVKEEGDTWMTPLFKYHAEGTLPAGVKKARAIRCKSWRFAVHDPSWLKPYLAYHAQRRKDVNKSMPRLSSSQTHPKESAAKSNPNYISMTNGLVKRANRSLGEGIKASLDARSKNWMEELPHVLWAHRTMIKSSNGDTPFSLTYGTEVVIPTEIGMPTLRTTMQAEQKTQGS
ncbi:reverse transcriptase domain-containing protein [Tanacetum coccineum]